MILKINYEVNGIDGIAYMKDKRIVKNKDVKHIEKLIEKKINMNGVKVTNWRVIGRLSETIKPFKEE